MEAAFCRAERVTFFVSAVDRDGAEGFFNRFADDFRADGFVAGKLEGIQGGNGTQEGNAAAGKTSNSIQP